MNQNHVKLDLVFLKKKNKKKKTESDVSHASQKDPNVT